MSWHWSPVRVAATTPHASLSRRLRMSSCDTATVSSSTLSSYAWSVRWQHSMTRPTAPHTTRNNRRCAASRLSWRVFDNTAMMTLHDDCDDVDGECDSSSRSSSSAECVGEHVTRRHTLLRRLVLDEAREDEHKVTTSAVGAAAAVTRTRPQRSHDDEDSTRTSTTATPYRMPTSQALRFVRYGSRYYRRGEGGNPAVRRLLHECAAASTRDELVYDDNNDEDDDEDDVTHTFAASAAARRDDAALCAAATRFCNYHSHHVLVTYKALRQRVLRCAQRDGKHAKNNSSNNNNNSDGSGSRSSAAAAAADVAAVSMREMVAGSARSLYTATLLLHLSSLYGISEKYIVRLFDVIFSSTVLLSMVCDNGDKATTTTTAAAATTRSRRVVSRSRNTRSSSDDDENEDVSAAACWSVLYAHAHELHWAVIHYSAAVAQWRLLSQTTPVMPLQRTRAAYARLLCLHARLVLRLVERCNNKKKNNTAANGGGAAVVLSRDAWHGLRALDMDALRTRSSSSTCSDTSATAAAAMAAARVRRQRCHRAVSLWFAAADGGEAHSAARRRKRRRNRAAQMRSGNGGDDDVPCTTDDTSIVSLHSLQRRLQLLPLLWLSMLCTCIDMHATPSSSSPQHDSSRHQRDTQTNNSNERAVTWHAPRHALMRVVQLFAQPCAHGEETLWLLLQCVFCARADDDAVRTPAAATATVSCAATHVEVCAIVSTLERMAVSFAPTLSSVQRTRAAAATSSLSSSSSLLYNMSASTLLRLWLHAQGQQQQQQHAQQHVAAPRVHGARGVYIALDHIPLCTLAIVRDRDTDGCASATRAVSLLYELLLRVLLQWRRAELPAVVITTTTTATRRRDERSDGKHNDEEEDDAAHKAVMYTAHAVQDELLLLLAAAHRVRLLHRRLRHVQRQHARRQQQQQLPWQQPYNKDRAQYVALCDNVQSMLHTAMRALCVQLSVVVLPRRVQLCQRASLLLSRDECALLHALHTCVCEVLLLSSSLSSSSSSSSSAATSRHDDAVRFGSFVLQCVTDADGSDTAAAGCVPMCYTHSLRTLALLHTRLAITATRTDAAASAALVTDTP